MKEGDFHKFGEQIRIGLYAGGRERTFHCQLIMKAKTLYILMEMEWWNEGTKEANIIIYDIIYTSPQRTAGLNIS